MGTRSIRGVTKFDRACIYQRNEALRTYTEEIKRPYPKPTIMYLRADETVTTLIRPLPEERISSSTPQNHNLTPPFPPLTSVFSPDAPIRNGLEKLDFAQKAHLLSKAGQVKCSVGMRKTWENPFGVSECMNMGERGGLKERVEGKHAVYWFLISFLSPRLSRTGMIIIHHTRDMYNANEWPSSYLLLKPPPIV